MYNPEIIQKLTAANKYTPRALHDVFGIDYNKPFFAACISGPATVNKLEKLITAAGMDPRNAENIVLIQDHTNRARRNDWYCVTLDGRGGFDIDNRDNYWRNGSTRRGAGFDWYCKKADFNEDRKRNTAEIIIISQHAEHLHKPAEKTIDPAERYKVIDKTLCGYADRKEHFISRVKLQRTTDQGSTFEIGNTGRVIYRGQFEPRTLDEVIDKSGYLVRDRRQEWKRRARALRAERDREAANAADYSNELYELDRLFQAKKAEAAAAILAANTYSEMSAAGAMIEDYKTGLKWTAHDIERVKDAAENKKFTSPEKARAAFESIRAKLDPASAGEEAAK